MEIEKELGRIMGGYQEACVLLTANKLKVFDAIASKLNQTSNVSFEWSLRIKHDCAQVRDKVICWINNQDNCAEQDAIGYCASSRDI